MTKRKEDGKAPKVDRGDGQPKLLVPTPAQLAAGVRLIDVDPGEYCRAVGLLVRKLESLGWRYRVTYSHFLAVPAVTGRFVGQWMPTHSQCVRMSGMFARAWGCWHGTEEGGWGWDSGQYWPTGGTVMGVSSTELTGLITGKMTIRTDEGTGIRRVEETVKKAAAVR